jgi:hypothetical protein
LLQALWHSLLTYIRDRNLLVEGPLNALRVSHIVLTKPDTMLDRRAFLLGTRLSSRYRPTEFVIHPSEASTTTAGVRGPTADGRHTPPRQLRAGPEAVSRPPGHYSSAEYAAAARPTAPHFAPPTNPFAAAPMLMPHGMLTQEALSIEQLSERGMSLASFGQISYGGGHLFDASQGYLHSALPEFKGFMSSASGAGSRGVQHTNGHG